MTYKFSLIIASEFILKIDNVKAVLSLLNEGATVPFIARYRKDQTGGMEDFNIFKVQKKLSFLINLTKRKKYILSVISDCNKLNEILERKIEDCWDEKQLEDIYMPFKAKRKTKAEQARQNGLEVFAKIIMKQDRDFSTSSDRFLKGDIKTIENAIEGARYIIAEFISENPTVRNRIRGLFYRKGALISKIKKGKEKEGEKYKQYFDFSQTATKVPSHRFLAIQRAQSEGILSLKIKIEKQEALEIISSYFIKGSSPSSKIVSDALSYAYEKFIKPSVENEILKEIKGKSDDVAIQVFAKNLKQLLLAPPLGNKRVMAVDPGFKSGCKVVCLDEQGNLIHNENIFPHAPQKQVKQSILKIKELVEVHEIDSIAIGNGTAGRETEAMFKQIDFLHNVKIFIVNENGASIYSASNIGREEFPNHDVTVRGAVSIGRRLIDPLAELVKIDPKSIGVGQYQHDVDQAKLKVELDYIVESCVNQIGVNVNTASEYLLKYVAGVGDVLAKNIVRARKENGVFKNRMALKKVPRLGSKVFEQCVGFMRVKGDNPLDNTSVHPENYKDVSLIAKSLNKSINELINESRIDYDIVNKMVSIGGFALKDIITELTKKRIDPRDEIQKFSFDESLKSIEDIQEGLIIPGLVTNLTNFGAFVDIGIKENGLVHISHIVDRFISSPMDVLNLNDIVKVKVLSVDISKKRITLSIKEAI